MKGLSPTTEGRMRIVCRDGSKAYYYRAVVEAHLGRNLRSDEIVHHINGDCTDDRIENLELVTHVEHMERHRKERCGNGHDLTPENVRVGPHGKRQCRACARESQQQLRERRAETHCSRGHLWTEESSVVLPDGTRRCLTCREYQRLYARERRAQAAA